MCVCVCRGDEDDDSGRNGAHIAHLGELEQSAGNGFHHVDAATLYFTKSKFFFFFLSQFGFTQSYSSSQPLNLKEGLKNQDTCFR